MTPGYKARREAKHAAQVVTNPPISGGFVQMIDPTSKMPSLTFIGLKSRPQANGGRKGFSGHSQEHALANVDNALFDVQSESKSIGGISEDLGLPGDNASRV